MGEFVAQSYNKNKHQPPPPDSDECRRRHCSLAGGFVAVDAAVTAAAGSARSNQGNEYLALL